MADEEERFNEWYKKSNYVTKMTYKASRAAWLRQQQVIYKLQRQLDEIHIHSVREW